MQGFWQTTFDAITVNGDVVSVSTQAAVIDTGTTMILGDQDSISNIYEKIPGSFQVQVDTGIVYISMLFTVLTAGVTN